LPLMGWNLTTTGASGQAQNIRTGGFSADHAAVFWGGLELNSMTLGSADLSLLPLFLFSNAQVSEMPQVGFVPNSAFAGAIQLSPEISNPPGLQGEWSLNTLQNATARLSQYLGHAKKVTTAAPSATSRKLGSRTQKTASPWRSP